MTCEENRRIVEDGLAQKKVLRIQREAEREAQQEAYEQDMISACNTHCADARREREKAQDNARRRAELARAKAKAWELECKAANAVRMYGILCLITLLVSATTKLPFWAAVALILGGAIFPAIYIFRLYNPLEVTK